MPFSLFDSFQAQAPRTRFCRQEPDAGIDKRLKRIVQQPVVDQSSEDHAAVLPGEWHQERVNVGGMNGKLRENQQVQASATGIVCFPQPEH